MGEGSIQIPLTKGYVAIIDREQFDRVMVFSWCASESRSRKVYARTTDPIDPKKPLYLHRLIASAPDGFQIDHKNRNTLDCRLDNLRQATNQQNNANKAKKSGCSSQYKGVHWSKKQKVWVASIHFNYGTQFIGHFHNEVTAAKAYDAEAKGIFGEFAKTNF